MKKKLTTILATSMIATGVAAAPASAQQTAGDSLVNVQIGEVNVIRNVDVAVAATIVANVCANVSNVNVALLAVQTVDAGQVTQFVCQQKGSGRSIAVTQN